MSKKTPEGIIKAQLIREFGTRPDILVFNNASGRAVYEKPDGATYTVPYGLTKEGSSDLVIGHTLTITPDMVGFQILRFGVAEVKQPGLPLKPKQAGFISVIVSRGGFGGRVTCVEDMERLLQWTNTKNSFIPTL